MFRRREIRRQAKALVGSLGDYSSEVAATLAASGVRGVPRNPFECAVSRYLHAVISAEEGIEEVGVGALSPWANRSELNLRLGSSPRRPIRVQLPGPVHEFLSEFDAGRFPGLTEEASRSAGHGLSSPAPGPAD